MAEELIKSYTYTVFKTPYGYMGIAKSLLGLYMIILPKGKASEVMGTLEENFISPLLCDKRGLTRIKDKILNYLDGKIVYFDEILDLGGATPFERRVWQAVMMIPRGEVRSYEWVARQIGDQNAKRAVGQALARNRLPIVIPCHRVVYKDGDLGGFIYGVNFKRILLKIEGRIL